MVDYAGWRAWRNLLRDDSETTLRDLLKDRSLLSSLTTAEPEDVVDTIMYLDGYDPEAARGLDQGCATLCADFRSVILSQKGSDTEIEIRKFANLIAIIRRLLPDHTVVDFHRRINYWCDFFEKISSGQHIDLRFDYFHILALSQDIAAKHSVDVSGMPEFWISVCGESGRDGRYGKEYVWVGMLGLRRLPFGNDVDAIIDYTLRGLSRWAATRRPEAREFKSHWHLLQHYFQRNPDFWIERVQRAIAIEVGDLTSEPSEPNFSIIRWWLNDISCPERNFEQALACARHIALDWGYELVELANTRLRKRVETSKPNREKGGEYPSNKESAFQVGHVPNSPSNTFPGNSRSVQLSFSKLEEAAADSSLSTVWSRNNAIAASGKIKHSRQKEKSPPKFQNPDNSSETWSGKGRPPNWLIAAESRGIPRSRFSIEGPVKIGVKNRKKRLRDKEFSKYLDLDNASESFYVKGHSPELEEQDDSIPLPRSNAA